MTMYRRTKAHGEPQVVVMSRGRYRVAEFVDAAVTQGLLVEVKPTERVCIPHETTANMTDDTCWWSKQLTDPMPCIWQDSVWLTKEDG